MDSIPVSILVAAFAVSLAAVVFHRALGRLQMLQWRQVDVPTDDDSTAVLSVTVLVIGAIGTAVSAFLLVLKLLA